MELMTIRQVKNKRFRIELRDHVVHSDMHKDIGGEDTAMDPAELLMASLGACIGMMVQAYCSKHALPSEGIVVNAVSTLASDPTRIESIVVDITLPEGFPENRREAVIRAAKTCPIHNTLESCPEIDIDIP
jgi:uncharacterized OsmC-like protein